MQLPPLWFVFDKTGPDFDTFLTEAEAQAAYTKRITQIIDEVGEDEYNGDEQVYMGRVSKRAELLSVGMDGTDELWRLVSCEVEQ